MILWAGCLGASEWWERILGTGGWVSFVFVSSRWWLLRVERSVPSVDANLTMRLVELEGSVAMKSWADKPSVSSALTVTRYLGNAEGWEEDKYSSHFLGRHWEVHPECWNVGTTSFCWVHHVGGTSKVRVGSLEMVQFSFFDTLLFWIHRCMWESTGVEM